MVFTREGTDLVVGVDDEDSVDEWVGPTSSEDDAEDDDSDEGDSDG